MGGGVTNRFRGGAFRTQRPGSVTTRVTGLLPSKHSQMMSSQATLPKAKRRSGRKLQAFIGNDCFSSIDLVTSSPQEVEVREIVFHFCSDFLEDGFESLITSLKGDFRRESARIQTGDDLLYFRVVSFLLGMELAKGSSWNVQRVVQALDIFSFRFLITTIDELLDEKRWKELAPCMSLYSRMIEALNLLLATHTSETHFSIVLGMCNFIFYSAEHLDPLVKCYRSWHPNRWTKKATFDMLAAGETSIQLLTAMHEACSSRSSEGEKGMKELKAASFDVDIYFSRMVSNGTIRMVTSLLSEASHNPPSLNQHIASFLTRVLNIRIGSKMRDGDGHTSFIAQLVSRSSPEPSLAPLLFSLKSLIVYDQVLTDPILKRSPAAQPLISTVKTVVASFFQLLSINRLLCVETLFQHSHPSIYCEEVCDVYPSLKPLDLTSHLQHTAIANNDGLMFEDETKREGKGEDEEEEEDDEEEREFDEEEEMMTILRAKKAIEKQKEDQKQKRLNKRLWTEEEDELLRREFPKYAELRIYHHILAQEELFLKNGRKPDQIKRRITFLKLGTDEEEEMKERARVLREEEAERERKREERRSGQQQRRKTEKSKKKRKRRARTVASFSSDEDEGDAIDDTLFDDEKEDAIDLLDAKAEERMHEMQTLSSSSEKEEEEEEEEEEEDVTPKRKKRRHSRRSSSSTHEDKEGEPSTEKRRVKKMMAELFDSSSDDEEQNENDVSDDEITPTKTKGSARRMVEQYNEEEEPYSEARTDAITETVSKMKERMEMGTLLSSDDEL